MTGAGAALFEVLKTTGKHGGKHGDRRDPHLWDIQRQ